MLGAELDAKQRPGAPTWDEWLWAYHMFTSRSVLLPESFMGGEGAGALQVALIPGLDMCNHDGERPNAVWVVNDSSIFQRDNRPTVVLFYQPRQQPASGTSEPGWWSICSQARNTQDAVLVVSLMPWQGWCLG